jgi:hypothetical protein
MTGWRAAPEVRWRQVGDETVLLHLSNRAYFTLDEVGAFAWQRLASGDDIEAVATAIEEAFEVDGATARVDLHALVEHLVAAGLLVPE